MVRLDSILRDKFSSLEGEFLDAFFRGSSALSAFVKELSGLQTAVMSAVADGVLSSPTHEIVRSTTSSILAIANNFKTLEPKTQEVDGRRKADIADAFQRLSLKEPQQSSVSTSTHQQSQHHAHSLSRGSKNKADEPRAEHIPLCYEWLMSNPHHPYPSHKDKERIASCSGTRIKTVDSWLYYARRRLGWAALSKAHFRGAYALTLDYAQRVLLEDNKDESVPPKIVNAFRCWKLGMEREYKSEMGSSEALKAVEEQINSSKLADSSAVELPAWASLYFHMVETNLFYIQHTEKRQIV